MREVNAPGEIEIDEKDVQNPLALSDRSKI